MLPSVYVETSVISYLASRGSGILRVAANLQTTRDWWEGRRNGFELFVSRFVVAECMEGDPESAGSRAAYLSGIPLLEVTDQVEQLADRLMVEVPLPENANIDALHIAAAAVHGVEYLLTWNCKHIANPVLRPRIEEACREDGFEPPVICTPQEMLEIDDDA